MRRPSSSLVWIRISFFAMATHTFSPPPGWAAMEDDDTPPASRDAAWYARCDFVDVDLATPEAKALGALLRRGLSHCAAALCLARKTAIANPVFGSYHKR